MRRWLEDVTFSLREVMSLDVLVRAARELDPDDAAMFAAVPEGQSYLAHQLLGAGPEQPAPGDVVFLVIDPAEGPAAVIAETLPGLLAQFPWLNVIVLTGGAGPDAAAVADLVTRVGRAVGAVAIRPELEPGAERRGGRIVGRLDRILADVGA